MYENLNLPCVEKCVIRPYLLFASMLPIIYHCGHHDYQSIVLEHVKKAGCVLLAALRFSQWPFFSTRRDGSMLTKPTLFQRSSHSIKLLHNNTGFLHWHSWVVKGLPVFPIQAQTLNDTDIHWCCMSAWNKRMSLWEVFKKRRWKWTAVFFMMLFRDDGILVWLGCCLTSCLSLVKFPIFSNYFHSIK